MTTTALYTSQAVGSTSGDGLSPQKVTLQASTTTVKVSVKFTNGNAFGDAGKRPMLKFVTSPQNITAANGALQLRGNSVDFVECVAALQPNTPSQTDSEVVPVSGGYFYCWLDVPTLLAAGTIDATLIEY